ncbi:MAG TPA: NADH-quinone oxidoreductase subunit N, partial [Tepidisphaeraceae bacterium]|nr:NADH-quinone oxidoreductase subunit N [Tepidisphaeraceae bacterium]
AEFFVLLLGATLGMSLMASTSNLLMIFLAIELASLPSYVLAGFRKTERLGAEASLKYVLFGAASSSIMVFGLSYLYGLGGSLEISAAAHAAAGSPIMAVALICVLVGVGFKIALVPLHFWCPDVFEGAGVDVAAFLSVASKGAGLILLMRLMLLIAPSGSVAIGIVIATLGALTATVANTAALSQTNVKRLLAYSSIAHAGYMLCVLPLLLTPSPQTAIQAILIYLAVYLFMNLGAFMVAGIVERQHGDTQIASFAGLGHRSPLLAVCMTIFLFSLIGLPPFAGFIAKLNIMWLLASAGAWWWALVAVIAVNTIISVYYYARVMKAMYFAQSDAPGFFPNPLGLGIAVISAILLIAMLLFFAALSHMTMIYAHLA